MHNLNAAARSCAAPDLKLSRFPAFNAKVRLGITTLIIIIITLPYQGRSRPRYDRKKGFEVTCNFALYN